MVNKGYRVEWSIDIDSATSPEDAARQAFAHMQRPGTMATVFDVYEHDGDGEATRVDLLDEPAPEQPLRTITASMEGIKVEIYPDHALRCVMNWRENQWEEGFTLDLPWSGDPQAMQMLTDGMNRHDAVEVQTAIAEAARR